MREIGRCFLGILEKTGEEVLTFQEKEKDNFLVIKIPLYYMDLLGVKLENIPLAYPLPHDLFCNILDKWGIQITHGVLMKIKDKFCQAKVFFKKAKKEISVDCGPADLYMLCLKSPFPIYAEDCVFQQVELEVDSDEASIELPGGDIPEVFRKLMDNLADKEKENQDGL